MFGTTFDICSIQKLLFGNLKKEIESQLNLYVRRINLWLLYWLLVAMSTQDFHDDEVEIVR